MKFVSNKIYLQDSPKTFGDLCKEASLKNEEMTKVAQAEIAEAPVVEPVVESTDSGDQGVPEELMDALSELKDAESSEILASDTDPLKVASIDSNDDGTVTVSFDKSAGIEELLAELEEDEGGEPAEEECLECSDGEEEIIEEACAYANDYGKFVKVANLTDSQKDYFKSYWASVWPEGYIDSLLIDQ
ncbi:hypothetical protein CMI47_23540 [Candidatus Pacearchaeota archaeon]|jgi:hypothetical protein|nr:hypothetical protein [Candidatus Pacearchaeota archaeon]|tara:strand:+ start:7514 stop:8077 length:564 start_codon:yes stop_codon:yes gene_type:complete